MHTVHLYHWKKRFRIRLASTSIGWDGQRLGWRIDYTDDGAAIDYADYIDDGAAIDYADYANYPRVTQRDYSRRVVMYEMVNTQLFFITCL